MKTKITCDFIALVVNLDFFNKLLTNKTMLLRNKDKERLLAIFSIPDIPIVVELFDWARLPQSFQRNIEAQHEVLYSNLSMMVHEQKAEYKKRVENGKDNPEDADPRRPI